MYRQCIQYDLNQLITEVDVFDFSSCGAGFLSVSSVHTNRT